MNNINISGKIIEEKVKSKVRTSYILKSSEIYIGCVDKRINKIPNLLNKDVVISGILKHPSYNAKIFIVEIQKLEVV